MRTRSVVAMFAAVTACGGGTSTGTDTTAPPVAPLANTAPPPPPRAPVAIEVAPPTTASAGAAECRVAENAPVLGKLATESARLGFDTTGGLAAWKISNTELALRLVSADGVPMGQPMTVAIGDQVNASTVIALPRHFVVLAKLWAWETKRLAWYGIVVERSGPKAWPAVELAIADQDVGSGRAADDATIVAGTHAFRIGARGELTPAAVPAGARPAASAETLDVDIINAATPPPPGPGGRIYEAMAEPTLRRARGGVAIGRPTSLEWHGNSVAHGMYADSYVVWSGTRFLYPFSEPDGDGYAVHLLAIDCH